MHSCSERYHTQALHSDWVPCHSCRQCCHTAGTATVCVLNCLQHNQQPLACNHLCPRLCAWQELSMHPLVLPWYYQASCHCTAVRSHTPQPCRGNVHPIHPHCRQSSFLASTPHPPPLQALMRYPPLLHHQPAPGLLQPQQQQEVHHPLQQRQRQQLLHLRVSSSNSRPWSSTVHPHGGMTCRSKCAA